MKERVENNGRVLRGLMSGMSVGGFTAPKRPSQRVKEQKAKQAEQKERASLKPVSRTADGMERVEVGEPQNYWRKNAKDWKLLVGFAIAFAIVVTMQFC
jgi:hypothetical protein